MDLINFYKTFKQNKVHNPNYNKHSIEIPFRALICCGSGGGKSNLFLNLLYQMTNTFSKIIICSLHEEPLYNMVKNRLKDQVEIYYDGQIPELIKAPKNENYLIVFDDLVLHKKPEIGQLYIRGRKLGYSSIYISQSFYKTDKIVRINCNYFWFGRGLLSRDLNMILSEFPIGIKKEEFTKIYNDITKEPMNFLCLDLQNRNLRKNINKIIYKY